MSVVWMETQVYLFIIIGILINSRNRRGCGNVDKRKRTKILRKICVTVKIKHYILCFLLHVFPTILC